MVLLFYKEHVFERRGESFSSRNMPVLKASAELQKFRVQEQVNPGDKKKLTSMLQDL